MTVPVLDFMTFGWRDAMDIILVTVLMYNVILVIRSTRAIAAIWGIISIILIYLISRWAGFNTLNWILENFLRSLFILVVIVFQSDIRHGIIALGSHRWLPGFLRKKKVYAALDILCDAAIEMAERNIGALIVLERNVPLGDSMDRGVRLDARISKDLLINLFWPNSPLHDGAVIIKGDRILAASCILPLSTAAAKRDYGTRHRAALGVTEETDAVVIVVSEERGVAAVAVEGKLTGPLDREKLRRVVQSALEKTE